MNNKTKKWVYSITTFGIAAGIFVTSSPLTARADVYSSQRIENSTSPQQTAIKHDFNQITRQIVSAWIEKQNRLVNPNYPDRPVGDQYQIRSIDNSQVKESRLNVGTPKRVGTGSKELIKTLFHTAENTSKGQLEVGYNFKDSVKQESSFTILNQVTHILGGTQEIEIKVGTDNNGFTSTTGIKYEYQNSAGNADMKGTARELGFEFPVKGILPSNTSAQLFTKIYKAKAQYEYEGTSYYTGNVTFKYKLLNVPGAQEQTVTKNIGTMMYELTDRGTLELYKKGFSGSSDPQTNRDALIFKGKAILEIDDEYSAITGMTTPQQIN
ncbi:hypothetical protein [Bacillus thuringiensis]|uniref:hypothetical protein n=1 Tax=Bacillus thuringiensis TaxID=1428 RepID=UPI000C208ED0|nr:hypothetical protein [Bacillus thuringiensis]MEB9695915.1 hypothetical protein [Bacillus cereus]